MFRSLDYHFEMQITIVVDLDMNIFSMCFFFLVCHELIKLYDLIVDRYWRSFK